MPEGAFCRSHIKYVTFLFALFGFLVALFALFGFLVALFALFALSPLFTDRTLLWAPNLCSLQREGFIVPVVLLTGPQSAALSQFRHVFFCDLLFVMVGVCNTPIFFFFGGGVTPKRSHTYVSTSMSARLQLSHEK